MTTITLPPEIEAPLADAARKKGTTPESLAVETLRQHFPPAAKNADATEAKNLFEYLADYIGKIDGPADLSEKRGEYFTDYLVDKHKKAAGP
jgi:hypothetical protein